MPKNIVLTTGGASVAKVGTLVAGATKATTGTVSGSVTSIVQKEGAPAVTSQSSMLAVVAFLVGCAVLV